MLITTKTGQTIRLVEGQNGIAIQELCAAIETEKLVGLLLIHARKDGDVAVLRVKDGR